MIEKSTFVKTNIDLRRRSDIIVQPSDFDTMSLEEQRKRIIKTNKMLFNTASNASEYDFMLVSVDKNYHRLLRQMLRRIAGLLSRKCDLRQG